MQRKTQITLITSGFLMLAVLVSTGLWVKGLQSRASSLAWGGPSLHVSERDYCMQQISALVQSLGPQPFGHVSNRSDERDSLLAIDLDQGVMWPAPPPVPWQRECVALPASLAWTLYCRQGEDTVTLPRFVCLKPSGSIAGTVALVGLGNNGMHLACKLTGPRQGRIVWEQGAFDPNSLYGGGTEQPLSSVMVTDEAELKRIAQDRPNKGIAAETVPLPTHGLDAETQNRMAWQALQKPLHQALEKQATDRGYDVARVAVYPGPDWTAGLAGVATGTGLSRGFWQQLFGSSRRVPRYLLFTLEADDNGLWQCRGTDSVNGSGRPGPTREPGFDFGIQTSGVGPTAVDEPLEPSLGQPRWSVLLDNGTRVELIGVYRDQGRTWWAPDGSSLDFWPGFSSRRAGGSMIMPDLMTSRHRIRIRPRMGMDRMHGTDEHCYAVLRVPSTAGFSSRSGSSSSGPTAVHYGRSLFIDRFGQPQPPGQYIVLEFDAQTGSTVSHGLGIHVLQHPEGRPGIIRSGSRNRISGGMTVNGGRAGGGAIAGKGGRSTAPPANVRALLPPDLSEPATGDIDDAQLQWIHLENLSLQANQETDFRMTIREAPVNAPTTSRVQVRR
ncbi:MAG: hypothetical protein GY809_28820 [Planctomycetes bacterium]|nr:hypothetical protein [Planctomycetota bacterium]